MTGKSKQENVLAIVLVVLVAGVLFDQARFLFVFPVPDTGMWFGDETWTMLTLRALARTGVARVPEALGSSLAHSNGLINGSVWISGLIYGVPAAIFSNAASTVAVGRIITFLLSLISLFFVYRLARRLGATQTAALIGVFALVISNAFYFSSHSARLDMMTGVAVLLFFFLLTIAFVAQTSACDPATGSQTEVASPTMRATNTRRNRFAFFIPFLVVISVAVYVHVPALIALPAIYSLWKIGVFRRWQTIAISLAGFALGSVLIVGAYWLSTGSLSLLGNGYNQYYNVANSLPILHLLSWRVQKINTIDRAIQVWSVAWPLVVTIVFGIASQIWRGRSGGRQPRMAYSREWFFFANAILLILAWGLFGGPAVFYNIYILPVAAVCGAVLIAPLVQNRSYVLIPLLIIAAGFTIISQEQFGAVGERLVMANQRAIRALVGPISSATHPPLVLTDEPAINEIAADPNVRLMTNHLLLFGSENKPLPEILREYHVDYLLLYSTVRWHSPFRHIADSLYSLASERTGTLTDQARSYDDPAWNEIDTLRLYKAK
ncbi:MAG TPA: hypothetical protein VFH95_09505 [Candidatus Kapabacteria bacterium]|nr:hypothetical protein [Candidatus Kapabacteria bacterium]